MPSWWEKVCQRHSGTRPASPAAQLARRRRLARVVVQAVQHLSRRHPGPAGRGLRRISCTSRSSSSQPQAASSAVSSVSPRCSWSTRSQRSGPTAGSGAARGRPRRAGQPVDEPLGRLQLCPAAHEPISDAE